MKKLLVDVWSDIACPWCYVGKRRLEGALHRFPHRDAVVVTWRAFELDPSAPRSHDPHVPYAARLARKYGMSVAEAEGAIRRMTAVAAEDGLDLRFDRVRPTNTFDAHRLIHLGAARGVQGAVKERLLRAYMSEGEALGDPMTLVRLAAEAGLEEDDARTTLASGAFGAEVREEEEEAQRLGIRGVPFFVIAGRYGISGAQPVAVLLAALEKGWNELPDGAVAEGAVCGPDGCA